MKRLLFLLPFLFFGCSSDSDTPTETTFLIGKWDLVATGWLVDGEEQEMSAPETTPCNLPFDIEYLDTGYAQIYGCNPYSTPIQINDYSGTWSITTDNGIRKITHIFPTNDTLGFTATIKQMDTENLILYHLTDAGQIRVLHFKKL